MICADPFCQLPNDGHRHEGRTVHVETEAPIRGMWIISSDQDLNPDQITAAKDALLRAAAAGEQVVVVNGIEFRWRPTPVDTSRLSDYEEAVDSFAAYLAHRDAEYHGCMGWHAGQRCEPLERSRAALARLRGAA